VPGRYGTTPLRGGVVGDRGVEKRSIYTEEQLDIDMILLKRWKHRQDQIAEQKQIIDTNIKGHVLHNVTNQLSDTIIILQSLPSDQMRYFMLHASLLCRSLSTRISKTMRAIELYLSNIGELNLPKDEAESEEEKLSTSYAYLMHIHRQIIPELNGNINVFSKKSKQASISVGKQMIELFKFMSAVETGIPPLPKSVDDVKEVTDDE